MAIDAEREHALVGWYQVLSRPNEAYLRLKLVGLDEMAVYFVEELGQRFTGSKLMNIGLYSLRLIRQDRILISRRNTISHLNYLR